MVPSFGRSSGKGPDRPACGLTSGKAWGAPAAGGLMPVTSPPQNCIPWEQALSYTAASRELRTGSGIQ